MKKLSVLTASMLALMLAFSGCAGNSSYNAETFTSAESVSEASSEDSKPAAAESTVQCIEYDIDPEKPVIALTFDDGPNTTTTPLVLHMLEKYNVRASFFLIGNNIDDASAEIVKQAYDMGCEINNHSKTHSYMNSMAAEDIRAEYDFVADKVEEITGERTKFFRPPYIAVSMDMYDNIDVPFINGVGCNDWDSNVSVDERVEKTLSQVQDGTIILLHDAAGNIKTVSAIDRIIPTLLEEGYQFATVSELFEAKGVDIAADDINLYTIVE